MRKKYFGILVLIMAVFLCACGHTHTWKNATCTEPKTCTECGETEGEPIGHTWKEATCTEAKTCTVCGKTEGEPTSHTWKEATCTEAKTCTVCGKTEGKPAGHDWKDANCKAPKTCAVCGETEGELGDHVWKEATCTEPKTCTICGKTEGELIEHTWKKATCTEPKTCKVCGKTEGESLGHTWKEATCTGPKTCTTCGKTEGEPLGHSCEKWKVTEKATCTKKGTETGVCTVCGEKVIRETELAEHTPGDWEIEKKATISTEGKRSKKCTVCGKVLESENYKLEEFDISKLKKRSDFLYDDFTKSWRYYAQYDKKYSDATESIMFILYSEKEGNNLTDAEVRAGCFFNDAAQKAWIPESIDFLIDGTIYHKDFYYDSDSNIAYSFLYNASSYKLIEALADTSKVKIKLSYTNGHSSEFDLTSNPFKTFCKDIVDNNLWDYYIPNSNLEKGDNTTIR